MAEKPCPSCEIVQGRWDPLGGTIAESEYFYAHQDVRCDRPDTLSLACMWTDNPTPRPSQGAVISEGQTDSSSPNSR